MNIYYELSADIGQRIWPVTTNNAKSENVWAMNNTALFHNADKLWLPIAGSTPELHLWKTDYFYCEKSQ